MRRELYRVVTISGPHRVRKDGRWIRDEEQARRLFNRVAANAKADTQVRLYLGTELVCCTGGDPDIERGGPLDEQEQRDALRTTGDE